MAIPPRLISGALLPFVLVPMAASGAEGGPTETGPVSCEIRVTEGPAGVLLEPVVVAASPLQGDYEFRVFKTSGAGTAAISQGGAFTAEAGEVTALGASAVDANGSAVARLTVRWLGGAVSCEKTFP